MSNDFHGNDRNPLYAHDRIELFAPSFNELRRMLVHEFPQLWHVVGGMMYHNHEMFVEYMNAACDTQFTIFHGVDTCCTAWLKKLQELKSAQQQMIKLPSSADPLFNMYEDACAKKEWEEAQKRKH